MPDNPYIVVPWSIDPSKKRNDHHFITSLLVSLGGYLRRLHEAQTESEPRQEALRSIDKLQRILCHRFKKEDAKNKLLKASCPKRSNEMDLRRLRIISILVANLVRGIDQLEICNLTRTAVLDGTNWTEILEMRRVTAGLMIDEVLSLNQSACCYSEIDPNCSLSTELMAEVFGGKYCIPFISHAVIDGCREIKRERFSFSGGNSNAKTAPTKSAAVELLETLRHMTPAEMSAGLDRHGYFHQTKAKQAVCLSVYKHLNRLWKIHAENVPVSKLPDKQNLLLMGPTGSGKSYMLELLFREVLSLPFVNIDCTQFSETGYVGGNTSDIFPNILLAADGNPEIAALGIVVLDEIDKLALRDGRCMVSRDGVQRQMLSILQNNGLQDVSTRIGSSTLTSTVKMDCSNILFIGCGAFSGLTEQQEESNKTPIGFMDQELRDSQNQPNMTEALVRYGMMPELVGRFHHIATLQPFSQFDLKAIIERKVINQHVEDLRREGITLIVEPDIPVLLANLAMKRGTNGRSIASAISEVLNNALYAAYSEKGCNEIWLYREGEEIRWEIGRSAITKRKPVETTQTAYIPKRLQAMMADHL